MHGYCISSFAFWFNYCNTQPIIQFNSEWPLETPSQSWSGAVACQSHLSAPALNAAPPSCRSALAQRSCACHPNGPWVPACTNNKWCICCLLFIWHIYMASFEYLRIWAFEYLRICELTHLCIWAFEYLCIFVNWCICAFEHLYCAVIQHWCG